MIKRLIRMGNERLQITAQPVDHFNTVELNQLIDDLFLTMRANAGVGIAAPQIGIPLQVVVFGFDTSPRYPDAKPVPETVLINPSYTAIGDESNEDWEGCLSAKGFKGLVKRYTHIQYQGYDPSGKLLKREASGFHARTVQHEIDHLHGILFIERIPNLKNFGFEDELQELIRHTGSKLG